MVDGVESCSEVKEYENAEVTRVHEGVRKSLVALRRAVSVP